MTRSRRDGFTLVELAICLSLLTILVPLMYSYALGIEDRFSLGMWHLRTADQVRTVSESLQRDQQAGTLQDGSVRFTHRGCTIDYRLTEDVLIREDSCGGSQALARGVTALNRLPDGVALRFTQALRAERAQHTQIIIPLEVACSVDM